MSAGSLTGTYAEKALCGPGQVFRLPDQVSFEQGAAIGIPYGTAAWAFFYRGAARAGETLLVHGASGGVGTAAVQLAKGAGLRVFGTAGIGGGARADLAEWGGGGVQPSRAGLLEQDQGGGGSGIDIILEMLANRNLGHDLTLHRHRMGGSWWWEAAGTVEIDRAEYHGAGGGYPRGHARHRAGGGLAEIYGRISAGLADRSLDPVIGSTLPLAEAARAHEEIMVPSGARLARLS